MARRTAGRPDAVHDAYATHGVRTYYERFGHAYRNPHEPAILGLIGRITNHWPVRLSRVLDLAAGSGEVTLALQDRAEHIDAIDPYTADAYAARTGRRCEAMTFEAVAAGALRGRTYSLIACSFAMHLAEPSRLPALCWELAGVGGQLLILTPHKRPHIDPAWGWSLTHETLHDRVRARLYDSQPFAKGVW